MMWYESFGILNGGGALGKTSSFIIIGLNRLAVFKTEWQKSSLTVKRKGFVIACRFAMLTNDTYLGNYEKRGLLIFIIVREAKNIKNTPFLTHENSFLTTNERKMMNHERGLLL